MRGGKMHRQVTSFSADDLILHLTEVPLLSGSESRGNGDPIEISLTRVTPEVGTAKSGEIGGRFGARLANAVYFQVWHVMQIVE